ncbi:MAG: hypothetical protein AAF572_10650 [Cyanobacteria bacterium P01_B01_bin.77]
MDQERIESVKAGIIAAVVGNMISLLCLGLEILVIAHRLSIRSIFQGGQRVAIATVCCFLFGVTYRYIVRQDPNPHLRSGAVGAFALTRSLSQLENTDLSSSSPTDALFWVLPMIESFGLFLAVRLMLDWSLRHRWLRPFATTPIEHP